MVKAEANLQPALNAWDTMVASFSKFVSRSHPGENHQNELVWGGSLPVGSMESDM